MSQTEQILGVRFFAGSASQAVELMTRQGGYIVVPAAPAMVKLERDDEDYRRALTSADLAIADSGLMVLLWRILRRGDLQRISGLAYLKELQPIFRETGRTLFVLPSENSKARTLVWGQREQFPIRADDCYVAPLYADRVEDRELLAKIDNRRPAHIIIAIGNGPQEKLGYVLRENLSYRPAIHCIGAALGFLTGDQVAIPNWADRFYLGWLFRLVSQPRIFIPRLTRALKLPWLIWKYGERLPPLQIGKSKGEGRK